MDRYQAISFALTPEFPGDVLGNATMIVLALHCSQPDEDGTLLTIGPDRVAGILSAKPVDVEAVFKELQIYGVLINDDGWRLIPDKWLRHR